MARFAAWRALQSWNDVFRILYIVALFIVLFMLLYNLSKSEPLYSAIYRKVFFGGFSSPKNPNTRRID